MKGWDVRIAIRQDHTSVFSCPSVHPVSRYMSCASI